MGDIIQERILKNPYLRFDGLRYINQGITLLAAQLANDEAVEDYWLITTPASIDHFGHVVAIIVDENWNKYALFVETKLRGTKKMRLVTHPETQRNPQNHDIPLYNYLKSYNKIMNLDMNNELKEKLQGIPPENFYFCLFTNVSRDVTIQLKNREWMNVKLDLKHTVGNILSCFGQCGKCPQRPEIFPEGYENFLKQFYIFAEQPDTETIYNELQEYIGKSTTGTIDSLCDVIESTMKDNEYCVPLTKITFFEKCLNAQLAEIILQ